MSAVRRGKGSRNTARCAATTVATLALLTCFGGGAAAKDYQERQDLTCTGSPTNCRATFNEVASGKVLQIQFVSCFVEGIGAGIDPNKAAFLGINNAAGAGFRHTLLWEVRTTTNRTIIIVSQPVRLRVPGGKRPDIAVPFPAVIAASGDCSISGNLSNAP